MIVEKIYSGITKEFVSYKITYEGSNLQRFIPLDSANTDYQAIQKWIAEGGEVIDNPPNE
jgi:hypothetical protein